MVSYNCALDIRLPFSLSAVRLQGRDISLSEAENKIYRNLRAHKTRPASATRTRFALRAPMPPRQRDTLGSMKQLEASAGEGGNRACPEKRDPAREHGMPAAS